MCQVTEIEVLRSARSSAHHQQMQQYLNGFYAWAPTPDGAFRRALEVQQILVDHGEHRSAGPVDLLVTAVSELSDGTAPGDRRLWGKSASLAPRNGFGPRARSPGPAADARPDHPTPLPGIQEAPPAATLRRPSSPLAAADGPLRRPIALDQRPHSRDRQPSHAPDPLLTSQLDHLANPHDHTVPVTTGRSARSWRNDSARPRRPARVRHRRLPRRRHLLPASTPPAASSSDTPSKAPTRWARRAPPTCLGRSSRACPLTRRRRSATDLG